MKIEVIVQNEQDAMDAEKYGADRLELVSAVDEGGLTPSYGAMNRVLKSVKIPVQVMIRPHSFGYIYDKDDIQVMKEDIEMAKMLGANGIVFGCLNESGDIDEALLNTVVEIADGMEITFHRAFDHARDQKEAYKTICQNSHAIKRILTSGGKKNAVEGVKQIQELVKLSKSHNCPYIMPGAGLNVDNITEIALETKAHEFHFGSGVRYGLSFRSPINGEKLKTIVQKLKALT